MHGAINDWSSLKGSFVQIRLDGRGVDSGQVETVAEDGTVLWLERHGANSRRLYARSEHYEAWPEQ
jgi:hypothetical protein